MAIIQIKYLSDLGVVYKMVKLSWIKQVNGKYIIDDPKLKLKIKEAAHDKWGDCLHPDYINAFLNDFIKENKE